MRTKLTALSLAVTLSLSLSTLAQQKAPSIVWQKCLGGSKSDQAKAMVRTQDNGFVIVGASSSNDGDVTGHHGAAGTSDGWVVKLSSTGSIDWQLSLGGSGEDELDAVTRTSDGGYVCLGYTLSNDGNISGNHGGQDLWVVKISRYGTLLWSKVYGGSGDETVGNIRENRDGSLFVIGSTTSNDGDVTGYHGGLGNDIWVLKLNQNGGLLWQNTIGGTYGDIGRDICEDSSGTSYIMTAELGSSTGDIPDPNANMYAPNGVVIKMDSTKSLKWMVHTSSMHPWQVTPGAGNLYYINAGGGYCYPNNSSSSFIYTVTDDPLSPPTDNSLVAAGGINFCAYGMNYNWGYTDFGPHALTPLTPSTMVVACSSDDTLTNPNPASGFHGDVNGFRDGFVYGQTPDGNPPNWKRFYGGSNYDVFNNIFPISETELIVCGYTKSNDGDVSGNHGDFDFWVVRLGQVNNVVGTVYEDYNSNGIKDSNEPLVSNIQVQSAKPGQLSSSQTYNGAFLNAVDTGTYTTTVLTSLPYYTAYPASHTSSFSSYNNSDTVSFALRPIPGKRDYSVHLYAVDGARPGFPVAYVIDYMNEGTDTLINRPVRFIKDSRLQFISSAPAQTSISGDTISWIIPSLMPRAEGVINIQMQVAAPPTVNFGDTLHLIATIDTTGDLSQFNNTAKMIQLVYGSFDPNDKMEVNGGVVTKDDLGKGKDLLYTIRFQNTGNDTAFNVVIHDTLSRKLDASTLEMTGASHPYKLTITNGNQLTWTFSNILLPDSTTNLAKSHGYVSYRVKPVMSVAVGDSIVNTAAIYFDYNLPVATNAQVTVVSQATVLLPPPAPVISGLQAHYCPNAGQQKIKITNIPAPSYQATVVVKVNGQITTVGSDSSFIIRPDTLATGQYTIMVVFKNVTAADTANRTFNVDAKVTPEVDLTSNITNVTDLSKQVVLTATNTAGGGATPLYAFSKDRTFATTVQAESSTATYSFDPSTLQVGNNSFYVRMLTSESCYTAPTAVDSLVIVRSTVTGIVDVDYPDQVINIYSNPFVDHLHITGLQSFKNYMLTLVRSNGQVVLRRQATGQQQVDIETGVVAAGVYLLNIYDVKKGRLIGTAKLLSLGK